MTADIWILLCAFDTTTVSFLNEISVFYYVCHVFTCRQKSHNVRKWATMTENVCSDICAQRLKSDRRSAQSDQSLSCPHEETLNPCLSKMRRVKILIRLRECAGWSESSLCARPKVLFLTLRFIYVCRNRNVSSCRNKCNKFATISAFDYHFCRYTEYNLVQWHVTSVFSFLTDVIQPKNRSHK